MTSSNLTLELSMKVWGNSDLVQRICLHLTPPHLTALSKTCHTLRRIVNALSLYENIVRQIFSNMYRTMPSEELNRQFYLLCRTNKLVRLQELKNSERGSELTQQTLITVGKLISGAASEVHQVAIEIMFTSPHLHVQPMGSGLTLRDRLFICAASGGFVSVIKTVLQSSHLSELSVDALEAALKAAACEGYLEIVTSLKNSSRFQEIPQEVLNGARLEALLKDHQQIAHLLANTLLDE